MKINAQVKLNLDKLKNTITLVYNTYEKATYDQYLIASMVVNSANSKNNVGEYIDDLTGNGSLNAHFKKLFEEIRALSQYDLNKILANSDYPIEKHESVKYVYYPDLNISLMGQKVYDGDIGEDKNFHRTLVIDGDFLRSALASKAVKDTADMYAVLFADDDISIKICKQSKVVTEEFFRKIVVQGISSIAAQYKGEIKENIEGDGWSLLNKSKLSNISDAVNFYYEVGNHYLITNTSVSKTIICQCYGLYFYKEFQYKYNRANKDICEKVINTMLASGKLLGFKKSKLGVVLENVSPETAQKAINYILERQDNQEMCGIGIGLINKGLHIGWSKRSLFSFKKASNSPKNLSVLYKISRELGLEFDINELLLIHKNDNTILIGADIKSVHEYFSQFRESKKAIQTIIGEVFGSGTRDREKELESDKDTKEFRKLMNDVAHSKVKLDKLSLDDIRKRLDKAVRLKELNGLILEKLQEKEQDA